MAFDWTRGMRQVCTWWRVDPETWHDVEPLDMVVSASVTLDASGDVHESATLEVDGDVPSGEMIVRGYVECQQGNDRARACVCTLLAVSPRTSWDGTHVTRTLECQGVLKELADDMPPAGWCAPRGADPLALAAGILAEHGRAPVAEPPTGSPLTEPWVAGDSDTWLTVARSLAKLGDHDVTTDRWGRHRIEPIRRPSALSPVWEFVDGPASLLRPSATVTANLGEIPNVVEASWTDGSVTVSAQATDDDLLAPTSLANRGRRVLCRVTKPGGMPDHPTEGDLRRVAESELAQRVSDERTVEFEHGLVWPLPELGECVRVAFADRLETSARRSSGRR